MIPQYEQLAVATLHERYRESAPARLHRDQSRRDRNVRRGATRRLGTLLIGLGSRLEQGALHGVPAVVRDTGS